LVGYFVTMYEERKIGNAFTGVVEEPIVDLDVRKAVELSVFSIILILSIAAVSLITGIHTVIVVSMACLIYPVLWLGIIGRFKVLITEFKGNYFKNLPKLKNEIILFMGAGLFATSINFSHLGTNISKILSILVGQNALLLAIVIILFVLTLSAIGIHPIVSVTIIGGTVKAAAYGVSPTYLALVLAISWAMGISISPSSATVIAISGLTGQSPLQVGPRRNGLYAIISSVVILIMLTIFRSIGLL